MECLVIGHRGASAAYPENTLAAFEGASALGADWVELDVRLTADGTPVIHHDAEVPDGPTIASATIAELPASVATLDAALATCRSLDLGVNIEIKSDPRSSDFDPDYAIVAAALEVVGRSGVDARSDGSDRYLVTSFDPGCLDAVRAQGGPATGQLVFGFDDLHELVASAAAAGHVAVNPWAPQVDEAFMAAARGAGLAVFPWTVDDPERMAELVELGVEGIITNVPDRLRRVLVERHG